MKFGFRKSSIIKSLAAKFSLKRKLKNSLSLRLPKNLRLIINPKKTIYNKIYNKTSFSFWSILKKLFR